MLLHLLYQAELIFLESVYLNRIARCKNFDYHFILKRWYNFDDHLLLLVIIYYFWDNNDLFGLILLK